MNRRGNKRVGTQPNGACGPGCCSSGRSETGTPETGKPEGIAIDRREFLSQVASSSLLLAAGSTGIGSGAARAEGVVREATVPRTKLADLSAASNAIRGRANHTSGIPLGGIGTGSVELLPDGVFDDWLIFNMGGWSPGQPQGDGGGSDPAMDSEALQFFLHARAEDAAPMVRRLTVQARQQGSTEMYSLGWIKPVQEIDYEGRFPMVHLRYLDAELPVEVTGRFFSPLIPHATQTSGTPGFHAIFTLKNTSSKPVTVSLASKLRNPLGRGADGSQRSADSRKLTNKIAQAGPTTYLTMRTASRIRQKATIGSLGLSVTGGQASWIAADFGGYLGTDLFGQRPRSFLEPFRHDGRLPNLGEADCPAKALGPDVDPSALSDADASALITELARTASMKAMIDAAVAVDPAYVHGARKAELLRMLRGWLGDLAGRDGRAERWGDAALCSTLTLGPGEEREIRFTLAWHFPHHMSSKGPEMGHMYEHWFQDAEEVNRFLVAGASEHLAKVGAFADTMAETTLGPEMAFCWTAQLTTLIKSSWWTRDNKFAIWEGLGCCGLHTTDITYQGSFPLIALYPELQQDQMENGARFQQPDGRVHHTFQQDLDTVDGGWNRVDMNPQFVMLICRDWLWTGDDAYLKRMWPHVIKAMDFTLTLDSDADGLPDQNTSVNTYDQWALRGIPAYIASLWLGALVAGIRLAKAMGDERTAAAWSALLHRGAESFDKKLWNGEYYSLWVDGTQRDECCMSDQLSGLWFTHLVGLGHPLPDERVQAALKAVVKHNFDREQGLINASYPPGKPRRFPAFGNFQGFGNWTGIEYAMASMLIDFGLVHEGLGIVSAVDDRYRRAGRCWNHTECGDHYYRAMSSWATLLAATGFRLDVPAATLTIAPPVQQNPLRAPWATLTGWGTLAAGDRERELQCRGGKLAFQTLRVNLHGNNVKATLDGRKLEVTASPGSGLTALTFGHPVELSAGQTLRITT